MARRKRVVAASLLVASSALAQSKNLLMSGNSFSNENSGVDLGLRSIAGEAWHPTPNVYARFATGQGLSHHATGQVQVGAVTKSLPPGRIGTWSRAQGHFFYLGTFTGPLAMQQEVRDRDMLAAMHIGAAHSAGTAALRPADDAAGEHASLLERLTAGHLQRPDPPQLRQSADGLAEQHRPLRRRLARHFRHHRPLRRPVAAPVPRQR